MDIEKKKKARGGTILYIWVNEYMEMFVETVGTQKTKNFQVENW